MERYLDEINLLTSMIPVTGNRETDGFGYYRRWGADTWHPKAGYSPIHVGRDYSAAPDDVIVAPCDAEAWGQYWPDPIGSYVMLRPYVRDEPSTEIAIYLLHCEPTEEQWQTVRRGEPLTIQAGHGIGAPHLHVECAVTNDLAQALFVAGVLKLHRITRKHWIDKAHRAGIPASRAMQEVRGTERAWRIEAIYSDAIKRGPLAPAHWKRSTRSRVYTETTWAIDLPGMWGG